MSAAPDLSQQKYNGPFPREFCLHMRQNGEGIFETGIDGLSKQRRLEELRSLHLAIGMAVVMLEIEIAQRFGTEMIPGR